MKTYKLIITAITLVISSSVHAALIELNPINAGWYTSDSNNTDVRPIANTLAGGSAATETSPGVEWRSFYIFDIPSLDPNQQIVGATLKWTFGNLNSPQGFETYALRSYEGSIGALATGSGSYSDLGDGLNYGEKTFYSSGQNFMELTSFAVNDLNSSLSQQIAIGGIITTLQFEGTIYTGEYYVTNSGADASVIQLALNVSSVPVPAAVWLFGSGVLSLFGLSRRKFRA